MMFLSVIIFNSHVTTVAGSVTVTADVHHSAAAADTETMDLSPIVANITASNDHSDASDTMLDDALNSTAVHVVDLSSVNIIGN